MTDDDLDQEDWLLEIETMLRQMRVLGFVALAMVCLIAVMSAKWGLWVNAISLSMAAAWLGFSLGLMTVTLHRRFRHD